jgi:hypothetical protein
MYQPDIRTFPVLFDSQPVTSPKQVGIGIEIAIAIGHRQLKPDSDTDSDPDADFQPIVTDYSIRLRRRRG